MTTKRGGGIMVHQGVRDLAAKTAAELRRRGRRTELFYDSSAAGNPALMDTCTVCLVGAIAAAQFGSPAEGRRATSHGLGRDLICEIARRAWPDAPLGADSSIVYAWNDNPDTTDDEVLAVLDSIAAGE